MMCHVLGQRSCTLHLKVAALSSLDTWTVQRRSDGCVWLMVYGIVNKNVCVARRNTENGTAHGVLRKTPERGAGY